MGKSFSEVLFYKMGVVGFGFVGWELILLIIFREVLFFLDIYS